MILYLALLDTEEEKTKFEQLYYKYRYTMQYVAFDILKDTQLAEDAVHEAFIRIAKNFRKIGEVSSPQTKGFAVIIVRNVALTMVKKELHNIEDIECLNTVQDKTNIEAEVLDKIAIEQVLKAIKTLSYTYRDTLYLYLVEEYSISEIADILQIPKETVKKRIQRGRNKIMEIICQEGDISNG